MQELEFKEWLNLHSDNKASVNSRISNCRTVEKFYGNLDELFERDRLEGLLKEFLYTKEDERENLKQKHRIPIDGNIYNGTASYRTAINLYVKFRNGEPSPSPRKMSPGIQQTNSLLIKTGKRKWPKWENVNEQESLQLVKVLSRYVKFLSPEIVEAVVEDNEKNRDVFREILRERNINPGLYFWDKSSCCFPGIRRACGSLEVASLRKKADLPVLEDALALDDNDFPKQLWSFAFRGTSFNKQGPEGYSLGHLVDHKKSKNRMPDEFDFEKDRPFEKPFYGLYTCASNSVFMPEGLISVKEFNFKIRNLLFRRAFALYGSFCNLVPPCATSKKCLDAEWKLENFEWASPVGTLENMEKFLEFRKEKLDALRLKSLRG